VKAFGMSRWRLRWKTPVLSVCVFLIIVFPLLASFSADCQPPSLPSARGPLLTTTRQAHTLSYDEAARAFPVHLRGVVTFYDYYQEGHPALFIADATGSIFVGLPRGPILPLRAGSVVEVSGVTNPGGFAPIIAKPEIRIVGGTEPLPNPLRVTLPDLLTGTLDGQWIAIEGLVHSVETDGMHVVLTLATDDGLISATTVKQDGANYTSLVDCKILIPAVAAPLVDNKRRMVGVRLYFPTSRPSWSRNPRPSIPLPCLFARLTACCSIHRLRLFNTASIFGDESRFIGQDGRSVSRMGAMDSASNRWISQHFKKGNWSTSLVFQRGTTTSPLCPKRRCGPQATFLLLLPRRSRRKMRSKAITPESLSKWKDG